MPLLPRIARPVVSALALAALAGANGGCGIFGVIAHKAAGPVKHPALFALPKEPTLVIVERGNNPPEAATDAQRVASEVARLLKENNAVTVVDPGLAIEVRSKPGEDGGRPRPTEIARACGATQLIYVDLTRYETSQAVAGEAVDGQVEAAVWVVDARTAQVRWPLQANQGYAVAAAVPFKPADSRNTEQGVRDEMNKDLGTRVARLFYLWTEE
ncbi:MAG: hypothetical protein JWO31_1824 [Phycisphaerales bacterium]|nr:hypothetical protein [Phycisphaerales bacterium]